MRPSRCQRIWGVGVATGGMLGVPLAAALTTLGCQPRKTSQVAAETIHVHQAVSREGRGAYLGSAACVECHTKEAEQLESHHASTLAAVTVEQHGESFEKPSNVFDSFLLTTLQTRVKDGRCVLELKDGPPGARVEAEYAFGSGNRGVTFLGRFQGKPVELRLSYFRKQDRWDFTPSQQAGARPATPVGRVMDPAAEEECYRCHTTALVKEGERVVPEQSILGVGCESCHGPGRDHVDAVRRNEPDLKMVRLSNLRERISIELCGQCHRSPANDDPSSPAIRAQLPRFQGLALARSACFKQSQGRLSCISCHDPHENAERTSREEYNARCLSCHTPATPSHVACPAKPRGDCVSCHMPEQKVDIPTNPTFRTHWIKVWKPEAPQP